MKKHPEITLRPTDLQLDIFSYFKQYKDYFYCFLDDETVVYKIDNDFVRIGCKEFLKQSREHSL